MTGHDDEWPSLHDGPSQERKCPGCGYLLTGLPSGGRCPECGLEYDDRVIVLRGCWAGHAPGWADTWWGHLVMGTVGTGLIPGLMWLGGVGVEPAIVCLGLGLLVFTILGSHRRWQLSHWKAPPLVVEITAFGLDQRTINDPAWLTPWNRHMRVSLNSLRGGFYRLVIQTRSPLRLMYVDNRAVYLDFQSSPQEVQVLRTQLKAWSSRWQRRDADARDA